MPSQADEEAHQLSYLQKHVANILSVLSDTLEGVEGNDALVCIFLFFIPILLLSIGSCYLFFFFLFFPMMFRDFRHEVCIIILIILKIGHHISQSYTVL